MGTRARQNPIRSTNEVLREVSYVTGTIEALDAAAGAFTVKGKKGNMDLKAGEKVKLDSFTIPMATPHTRHLTITPDIDTITLAVETTKNALKRALVVKPTEIGAVYVGFPASIFLISQKQ